MRVLLIEDDRRLARLMARVLGEEHYQVDLAHDGETGLDLALRGVYEVAIVDWMLPGRDGPGICRAVRAARLPTALLLLTARGQVEDKVAGFASGADDYLVKPFAPAELLARVRALLRRGPAAPAAGAPLRYADLAIDQAAREVWRGSRRVSLSPKEYDLLALFLRHPRQVLARDQILEAVWGYDFGGNGNVLEVYVGYLRQKTEAAGEPRLIQTVRGVGYVLREDVDS